MNNHHLINYIEFAAEDLEVIKEFYTSVFGWSFTDYGPEYCAFAESGVEGGFAQGKVTTGGPLVILYSNDLEETKSIVESHGGVISKDIYVFPGGRRFHFRDPAGNELAVWSDM